MISHGELGDVIWRKSSKSGAGGTDCVSIALVGGSGFVRDSKDPHAAMIELSTAALRAFILATKAGAFDR